MDIQTQKKLDYLEETKQLLREAIEEMGQTVTDTDPFRSYAEKIRAAKPVLQDKTITENGTYTADEGYDGLRAVTVDVAGSGGGSLPAGCYWSQDSTPPLNYPNSHFVFNGELYLWAAKAESTSKTRIYKVTDSTYTQICEFDSVISQANMYSVQLGGKLHAFDSYYRYHYVFDGTSVTRKTDLPVACYGGSAHVMGELLYIKGENVINWYVWDESADSWTATTAISGLTAYQNPKFNFYHNNVLYLIVSTTLYQVVNGVATSVGTLAAYSNMYAYNNGFFYYIDSGFKVYKMELESKTSTQIGLAPVMGSSCRLYSYNNHVVIAGGTNTSRINMTLHEVEATE